jgi:hypothetical protein
MALPFEGTVVLGVVLAACLCSAQGLGDVAAREKAKRDAAKRDAATRDEAARADALRDAAARDEAEPAETLRDAARGDEALDETETGLAAPSSAGDARPAGEPAEPDGPRAPPAQADPPSAAPTTGLRLEDIPPNLPWCEPGLEMLRAWSDFHAEYAEECGRADLPSLGRFDIEIVVSGAGRLEAAIVDPENAYTTCLAQRLRGRSMPRPADGKRCRSRYSSSWKTSSQ